MTGVVLGVGVHPIDDPSPLMDLLLGDGTSGAALALRSSTRAVPMLVLGLALGAGALVDALGPAAPRRAGCRGGRWPLAGVGLLALANLPCSPATASSTRPSTATRTRRRRGSRPPPRSTPTPTGGRVLQLPGQEFGAFRWGYTVDPPLPGLTDRPLVTRDLLPLGSAPAMDLLYALDDRFQSGTVDPASIAPVARLLGADTIWLTGDAAFDRFRTARPELVARPLRRRPCPASAPPVPYGDAGRQPARHPDGRRAVAVRPPRRPAVAAGRAGPRRRPAGRRSGPRTTSCSSPAAATALVDAAAAGLLDGRELVRYTRLARRPASWPTPPARRRAIIVTDSNRDRAHHWRSSQDVVGFTEDDDPPSPDVLRDDPADERLPVFGDDAARRRRSPSRTGRCGPGRRPTASRSPTGPRTGR